MQLWTLSQFAMYVSYKLPSKRRKNLTVFAIGKLRRKYRSSHHVRVFHFVPFIGLLFQVRVSHKRGCVWFLTFMSPIDSSILKIPLICNVLTGMCKILSFVLLLIYSPFSEIFVHFYWLRPHNISFCERWSTL